MTVRSGIGHLSRKAQCREIAGNRLARRQWAISRWSIHSNFGKDMKPFRCIASITVALAGFAFFSASSGARADTASCRASCYSYSSDPAMCLMSCGSGPSPGYDTSASFGAIYISSSTGASGLSSGRASRSAAEQQALGVCRAQAGQANDCKLAIWFDRRCAALAIGQNKAWGARYEISGSLAIRRALAACRAEGGVDCRIVRSNCSG